MIGSRGRLVAESCHDGQPLSFREWSRGLLVRFPRLPAQQAASVTKQHYWNYGCYRFSVT